jgi:glycosyltransferase involved in cell wall biosynthesis
MVRQYRWAIRQQRLFASYRHIVVASGHMADEFTRNGASGSAVSVVPLFPTIASAGPRPRPAIATVVSAGRLTPLKGADVLLRAMAHARTLVLQPSRVIVAGVGPEMDALKTSAASLGLDVAFPGWVTGAARIELLRSATVFAMPSLWPEPFGLGGLEAAAHGVPAVAFDVGGIAGWLRDGVNGRLVREYGSAEALGRAIAGLLNAPDELGRLERGALTVAAELSLEAHLAAIERVLAGAARPLARAT